MTQDELLAVIEQAAVEGWTELDLRDEEVKELPSEIGELTQLETLVIGYLELSPSKNPLTSLPPEIGHLSNLRRLEIFANQLAILPPEIGQLTKLEFLWIGRNEITTLPPEIGQLTKLQSLNLLGNYLTYLPSEIGELSSLKSLYIQETPLSTFSREITRLTNLQSLSLINTKLESFPQEIGQLTTLQSLNFASNQLKSLPSEIGQLSILQKLNLSTNQLTTLPLEISQLSELQSLGLSSNQFTSLPLAICQLFNLKKLLLNFNQLTVLPPEIGALTALQSLELMDNELITLPSEIGQLEYLTTLVLKGNQLSMLPVALRELLKLETLHLYDNPLPLPPELLGEKWNPPSDPQNVLDTYFQESRPLREAKLMLLGEGSVGKTSLVERLLWDRPPSDSGKTVGVDIFEWGMRNAELGMEEDSALRTPHSEIQVNVWDFGGQEIYHATHQFFLTHRSLYLLVIEARKDEEANRLEYWLRHVRGFAGEAPLILVVNKIDQHPPTLDERGLMLKYPAIRAVVHTSCTEGTGIDELREAIGKALAELPHLNDWIPLTWYAVKEKLTALAQRRDYLPYESYVELCREEGIEHEAAQRTLARFLHDLGAALNFQEDRRLAGTHVLDPEWVSGGIYRILNAKRLQGRGILRLRDLDEILDRERYPAHKHHFLLDVMGKFELGAPLGDGRRYLIPGLLAKERPDFEWPAGAPTALEYRYAILPAAVLSRLMVRLQGHTWADEGGRPIRWRNGVVLAREGRRALVTADTAAARLRIALDGEAPGRRHLLTAIRLELDEIHGSFAQLEAEEWVPIPGHPGKAYPYQALLKLEAKGLETYYDPVNDLTLNVTQLLDGVDTPAERKIRQLVGRLEEGYNLSELRRLAFRLDVDHEDLPYHTQRSELARELAKYLGRRGRLAELEDMVGRERPGGGSG